MQVIDIINVVAEAAHVGKRTQIKSSVKTYILDRLNIEYKKMFNSYGWDDIKLFNLDVTTSDGIVTLPRYVDSVRAVRRDTNPLLPLGELQTFNYDPASFDTASNGLNTSSGYIHYPSSALFVDASADGVIQFKSSSVSDETASALTIRIEGLTSDHPSVEENDLNGTTLVSTTASFDAGDVIKISKPLTTGTVIIYAANGTTELGRIGPDEYQSYYKRIQLNPVVDESTTVTIMCTRKFERLVSDNDSLNIPRLESAVIHFTTAEVMDWTGHPNANNERAKGQDAIKTALLEENTKNSKNIVIRPASGLMDFHNDNFDVTVTGVNRG